MNTYADKTQKNRSQSVASAVSQKKSSGDSTFQFVDNRPEAIAQRKLQEIANKSTQANKAVQLQSMAYKKSANNITASTYQLQKAVGWYRMEKSGKLRNENATHSVERNLAAGTVVKVIDKGARVSNFKAGLFRTNEHSWSKIPLQNQTGWTEDGKLGNSAQGGLTPHPEFLGSIGAGRADYHFGLNNAGAQHRLGPRMDYVEEIEAGTVAEYDWGSGGALPAHIIPADHTRLAGPMAQGMNIAPVHGSTDPTRVAAANFKNPAAVGPAVPAFGSKYEEYTWHRKALNSRKAHNLIKTNVDYSAQVHPGVDFSKSALIDQLVQHKHIHFHVSGMKSLWKGLQAPDMTGADFMEVINKGVAYAAAGGALLGNMKDDVTFRELRFIWRYWNESLYMPDDNGHIQTYTFDGNVTFYFNNKKVKPPWLWQPAATGASAASGA